MRSSCLLVCTVAIGLASLVSNLHACNVPVFRYALENWRPDPYQIYVLHDGDLSAPQQELVDKLLAATADRQPPANMVVHAVDIKSLEADQSSESEQQGGKRSASQLSYLNQWSDKVSPSTPWIIALYPWQLPQSAPAWNGALTDRNVQQLVDSQIRQEIASRILAGQSAVWVLIESGNAEKDGKVHQQLEQWLSDMPDRVSLPDRSLIESDESFRPDTPIELKVEFSAIRLSRDNPDEQALVSMLLGSEDDLRDFDEPIAVPVYGRGRTYFALVGRGINEENVRDNCQFICGACSCQVKQENPGVDLLLTMNWDEQILGSAIPDKPIPELTGVGIFEVQDEVPAESDTEAEDVTSVAMNTDTLPDDARVPIETSVAVVKSETAESGAFEGQLLLGVAGLLVFGVLVLAGLTVLLRRQSGAG